MFNMQTCIQSNVFLKLNLNHENLKSTLSNWGIHGVFIQTSMRQQIIAYFFPFLLANDDNDDAGKNFE